MKKILLSCIVAATLLNAGGAYACVFATDPAKCREMRHCDDESSVLYPFCYLGGTQNPNA